MWTLASFQLDSRRGDWTPASFQLDSRRGDWRERCNWKCSSGCRRGGRGLKITLAIEFNGILTIESCSLIELASPQVRLHFVVSPQPLQQAVTRLLGVTQQLGRFVSSGFVSKYLFYHGVVLVEEDGVVDGGVAHAEGPLHHHGLGALPHPGQGQLVHQIQQENTLNTGLNTAKKCIKYREIQQIQT